MKNNKNDDFRAKLGATLKTTPKTSAASPSAPPSAAFGDGAMFRDTVSISYYAADDDKMREIEDFMRRNGVRQRLGRSAILRLALRACPLTDELLAVYESMQEQDGRRK